MSNFELRSPGEINRREFVGMANGIPLDAVYSSELDRVVIGSRNRNTGINAFQNPEAFDITLLLTPGFNSGAVIAEGLQMCERRGDCIFLSRS